MDSEDEDLQLAYRLSLEHPQPGMQHSVPASHEMQTQGNYAGASAPPLPHPQAENIDPDSDEADEDAQLQAALLQSMYDMPASGMLGMEEEDALLAAVIQSLQDTDLTGTAPQNSNREPPPPHRENGPADAHEGRENANLIGAECSVCFGHIAEDTVPHPYPCNTGSVFCGTCQYEQCRVTVQDTEIGADEIRCPCNCGEVWPPELLRQVDETLYDQHMRQLVERRLIRDEPDFRWCQNPACAAGALYPGASATQPYVICPTCQDAACFLCQNRWEEGHREDCPLHAPDVPAGQEASGSGNNHPGAAGHAQPEGGPPNQQDQENVPPELSPRSRSLPRLFRHLLISIEEQIALANSTITQMEHSRHAAAQTLTELLQELEARQGEVHDIEATLTALRDQQSEISETLRDIRTAERPRHGPPRTLNLGPHNRLMNCIMDLFSQLRSPQSVAEAIHRATSDEDADGLVRELEAGHEELDVQIEVQEDRMQRLGDAMRDVQLRRDALSESRIMSDECARDEDTLRELIAQLRCLEERVVQKAGRPFSLVLGSITLRDSRGEKARIQHSIRTIRQRYILEEEPVGAAAGGRAPDTFLNPARQHAGAAGGGVVGGEEDALQAERRIRQRRLAREEEHGRQVAEMARRDEARMEQHKRCPWCNTPTERTAGCDHMTCSVCHREWCYICMRRYPTPERCGVTCRAPARQRGTGEAFFDRRR